MKWGLIRDFKKGTTKRDINKRTTETKFLQKVWNVEDIFFENITCTPIIWDFKEENHKTKIY